MREAVGQRLHRWLRRSPREWQWAIARRISPWARVSAKFDQDLQIEVCLRDELALRYLTGQTFEPEVTAVLNRVLRPGMTVFDLGANIGHFTLLAAKRVASGGSVHAFEPAPAEIGKLRANVALNRLSNVVVVPLAVTDYVGNAALHLAGPGFGLYNSLGHPFRGGPVSTVDVSCTTVDAYVEARRILRVDLVKIDVEGAETAVLRGARRLLERRDAPMLICEFSDHAAAGLGQSVEVLRDTIEGFGYDVYGWDASAATLVPEPRQAWYDYANVFCTKRVPA